MNLSELPSTWLPAAEIQQRLSYAPQPARSLSHDDVQQLLVQLARELVPLIGSSTEEACAVAQCTALQWGLQIKLRRLPKT